MSSNPFLRNKEQTNSTNRFSSLEPNEEKGGERRRGDTRRDDTRRNNKTRLPNIYSHKQEKAEREENIINDTLFPSLATNNKQNDEPQSANFKEALNQVSTKPTEDIYKLKAGWIQIYKTDGKHTIIDKSTPIKQEITDLNNEMYNVIQNIEQNWLRHKVNYDNIHGKGAYDDLHYLTPVYGSD
jgi:hypothetical protein